MVITSQSSNSPFGPTTKLAPPSQSSFGLPTSSGIGTMFGVPNTPSNASATSSIFGAPSPAFPTGFTTGTSNVFPITTLGFGKNSNQSNASATSSIFGAPSSAFTTGFTTGTSNAFPSTTLGFGKNSNQSNASTTSSIFGVSSPAFPTGFTTGTSNVFPITTLGFGKNSNQSNASVTSSIFGAPSSAFTTGFTTGTSNAFQSTGFGINSNSFGVSNNLPAFATACSTGTSHAFPSMTPGFGNNSTNTSGFRFGFKSSTESQGVTKQKPTTGSRKVPYSANRVGVEKLQSISGMPVYEAKSHEELRLEDYELKHNSKGDGCDTPINIFRNPNNKLFGPPIKSTTSSTISTFVPSSSPFPQTSPFNTQSLPAFINQNTTTVPSPNPFSLPKTNPNPSQPHPFVPSSANPNPFSPYPSNVPINTCNQFPPVNPMAFTNSPFSTTVSPSTTSLPALGPLSSIPNTSQPAVKSDFHFPDNPSQPSQASSSSTSAAKVGYLHINGQQQQYVQANSVGVQSTLVADPFPTRSEIDRPNTGLTLVQHGISSLPSQVPNKLSANRSTSSLRIRHVSPRLNSLPPQQRYTTPSSSERKVAFFNDGVDRPGPFLPRENPRAWVTNSLPSPHSSSDGKCCEDKDLPCSSLVLDPCIQEETEHLTTISISQQTDDDDSVFVAKKHEDDVLALLPKLPNRDEYYTEPSLTELAAKEMDEPGSLSRVNDFVVGKPGYGSIKFLGETDVRHLDLGTIVQFKNREVIVYADEKTKPVVGEGMNKTAEVTLLNVKCVGKKTGKQYVDGPRVESYKEMLMKKGLEQGTEFVSYDPVRGEWRFRVQHF